jgi:hypothetical protein
MYGMKDSEITTETVNFVPSLPEKEGKKENFKILEILVVLSAVTVVGLLALLAINPSKEAAQARNMKRSADIASVLAAVSSWSNKNGKLPEEIPTSQICVDYGSEICKTGPYDCTDLVNMSFLSNGNSDELVQMPQDPLYVSINGTGYYISQNGLGYVTVCAPHAERNEKISFSKMMY